MQIYFRSTVYRQRLLYFAFNPRCSFNHSYLGVDAGIVGINDWFCPYLTLLRGTLSCKQRATNTDFIRQFVSLDLPSSRVLYVVILGLLWFLVVVILSCSESRVVMSCLMFLCLMLLCLMSYVVMIVILWWNRPRVVVNLLWKFLIFAKLLIFTRCRWLLTYTLL